MVSFIPMIKKAWSESAMIEFDLEIPRDIQALKHLRLVNKIFDRAASPYLFQTRSATTCGSLGSLAVLSRSRHACHVRVLFVYWPQRDHQDYIRSVQMILPAAVSRLISLRKLTICGSELPRERFSAYEHLRMTEAVCNTLQQTRLNDLESLEIESPSAHCLARLVKTATVQSHENGQNDLPVLMRKLRQLKVRIYPDDYAFRLGLKTQLDPTGYLPPPEHQHLDVLIQLVNLAPNLEFMAIQGGYRTLNLNPLNMQNFIHLQELRFCAAKTSSYELWRFFWHHKDTLQTVRLARIGLTAGTWVELQLNMRSLSKLMAFSLDKCEYYDSTLRRNRDITPQDAIAFGALQSQITRNRLEAGIVFNMIEYVRGSGEGVNRVHQV